VINGFHFLTVEENNLYMFLDLLYIISFIEGMETNYKHKF
jgi:hypothetical protein